MFHLKDKKRHKAPGMSGLVVEMIQSTGDIGIQWILDLCNGIAKGCFPNDCKSSMVMVWRFGVVVASFVA